jgi:hypothetical protein
MTHLPTDDLDLDSLLADSIAARQKKASTPKPPRTPKPKDMSSANAHWLNAKETSDYERKLANADLRALWKPQTAVAMFSVQVCLRCGARHTHFEGFFQQQRHASHRDTEKWVPATDSTMLQNLPKHKKITLHEADACIDCIVSLDYINPSPTDTEPPINAWTPSKHHSKLANEHLAPRGFGRESETPSVE